MSIFMSFVYLVIMLIYIPLFITVMQRLKIAFPNLHSTLNTKVTVVFVIYMFIMSFRYAVYLCLQFANLTWLDITKLDAEIPFYLSELLISIFYSWFLI